MGEGIQLELSYNNQALKKLLNKVSKEINTIDRQHEINLRIDLKETVGCDNNRISQFYSNLLGNAINHGVVDKPIKTEIKSEKGIFSIYSNSRDRIPDEKMGNLFKPFFTTNSANNKSRLGLGLYISSEIAKAPNGK